MVTVPNRFSQVASSKSAATSSGRAEVASVPVVRGPLDSPPQPVADDAADQGGLVAGIAERPQHAADLRGQVDIGQLTVGCHAGGPQPA